MSNFFAVIENGKVLNVIVADTVEIATEVTGKECVAIPEGMQVIPNWTYDGTTFEPPTYDGTTFEPPTL